MRRHWRIPAIGLVDPLRRTIFANDQIIGPQNIAKRRTGHWLARGNLIGSTCRFWVNFGWFWIGRLKAETAGHFNRSQNQLQHMKRTAGLKPV